MKKEILIISVVLVLGIFGYIFYDSVSLSPDFRSQFVSEGPVKVGSLLKKSSLTRCNICEANSDCMSGLCFEGCCAEVLCEDSDGMDQLTQGFVQKYFKDSSGMTHVLIDARVVDFCEGNTLNEGYCDGSDFAFEQTQCSNCVDGVCEETGFRIIMSNDNPEINEEVTFSAVDLPQTENIFYYWILSSGGYSYDASFTESFSSEGDYSVSLTLYDSSDWSVIDAIEKGFSVGQSACGGCPSGSYCNLETSQCVDCLENSHCDNNLFCDGVEQCNNNVCEVGTNPCPINCDEDLDQCVGEVTCSQNSECGSDGFIGSNFCQTEDVYRQHTSYTCNNPGTSSSFCTSQTVDQLISDCAETCEFGACVDYECSVDPDCDDGLYCTGVESCSNHNCISGNNPCVLPLVCNENADSCDEELPLTIHYSPEDPSVYQEVEFWATGGAGTYYQWQVGENPAHYNPSFSSTFEESGDYGVSLQMLDESFLPISGQSAQVTVSVNGAPAVIGNLLGNIGDSRSIVISNEGNTVLVGGEGFIASVDVSNPTNPQLIKTTSYAGSTWQMSNSGNLLAVSSLVNGVYLFDISDPGNPGLLGRVDTYGIDNTMAWGVAFADGTTLYIASEINVKIVDVVDPSNPVLVNTINRKSKGRIEVYNGRAYIGEIEGPSLLTYNVVDVQNPQLLDTIQLDGRVFDIDAKGPVLGIIQRNIEERSAGGGVTLFDISGNNKDAPQEIFKRSMEDYTDQMISVGDEYVSFASYSNIGLIDIRNIEGLRLLPVGANVGGWIYSLYSGNDGNTYVGMADGGIISIVDPVQEI